ncbi:hypothetical protein AC578_8416 [Pseudocercospora eumusae]|uniref:SnoaL-like domain-containing protein n=1 Tax=Pseudocercospora eumusae TaxID=321146 RepID=A0A139HRX8_9PEZI|nr:hypothetical protein AC578_8416 [Pseudocercospora eumusae]
MTQLTHETADAKSIKTLISTFFDAINNVDITALEDCFTDSNSNLVILRQDPPRQPSASNYPQYRSVPTTKEKDGKGQEKVEIVIRTSIEKFIELIREGEKRRKGQPKQPVLHESPDLNGTDMRIDHSFGQVWSPFNVTFDGILHHYGSLAYTVAKVDGEWKIEGLTQNYRRTPGWESPHAPGDGDGKEGESRL